MNSEVIVQFKEKKEEICNIWVNSKNVVKILNKYNIQPSFFQKHFAVKVINHILDISKDPKLIDKSPIMYIMTLFFKNKNIDISDTYVLCSELAFILQENFEDKICSSLLEILDNKLQVVEDYMDITRKAIQNDALFVLNTKTNEKHLKNIRFTTPDDLDSNGLIKILDDNQFMKISELKESLDSLILLLDEIISLNSEQTYQYLPDVISYFIDLSNHLSTIALFPIITSSFDNMVTFLSTLKLEDFNKEEKRSLLFIMLTGLSEDLSKWLDAVFIQKIADDIYYGDASFANNCLEIELLFDDLHEEKNTDLNEQIMSQDNLMMHLLD